MSRQATLKADLLLIAVAIVWGTSYGMTKTALLYVPVLVFLTLRFGLTTFVLLPNILQEYRNSNNNFSKKILIGISTGLILLTIFLLEVYGVNLTKASNAAFLISLFVVFTPFAEWLILGKRPEIRIFIVAFVCLIGIGLITGGLLAPLNIGDGFVILAGLCRALMVVLTKKLTNNLTMSALFLTGLQSFSVFFGSLIFAFIFHQNFVLPQPPNFWITLMYLVVLCTIFAFFAQNYAIKLTKPSRVSILLGTEPLFGAVFAMIWLGEKIGLMAWIGGLIIVGSSVYLTLMNEKGNQKR